MSVPLVLIVEDEVGLLQLFASLLNRLNCQTLAADGGNMAIDILYQQTPDLMILDLAMPDVDGFEVMRYVRSEPRLDAMKVLILTARPGLVSEIETMGIDCWVTKPVLPNDFLDIVSSLLPG